MAGTGRLHQSGRAEHGSSAPLPRTSNRDFLRDLNSIVNLDAKTSNCALDLVWTDKSCTARSLLVRR